MAYLPEKGKHLPKPSFLGCQPLVFGVLVPLFGMDSFLEKDMGLLVGLKRCQVSVWLSRHIASTLSPGGLWLERLGGRDQT